MRQSRRKVPVVGLRELKTVQEAVEMIYTPLISNQCLGGPCVGSINHPHSMRRAFRVPVGGRVGPRLAHMAHRVQGKNKPCMRSR
jgi:hypothetical protein